MRRARIFAGFTVAFSVAFAFGARAKPAASKDPDATGQYRLGGDEHVGVLQGQDELWFVYEGSPQDCWCVAQGKADRYGIWSVDGDLTGVLDFPKGRPSFKPVIYQPPCCSQPNWGGMEPASKKKPAPPKKCVVTAEKAHFHDRERKETKTYVIKGDSVDVVGGASNDGYILGRFAGKKKATLGLLFESEVDCGKN